MFKIKNSIFLFMFCLLIMSCSKESSKTNEEICESILTANQIEFVGIMHNNYLSSAFYSMDFGANNLEEELKLAFMEMPIVDLNHNDLGNIDKMELLSVVEKSFDPSDYSKELNNLQLTTELYDAVLESIHNPHENWAALNTELVALELRVSSELQCLDRDILMASISTAKYSSKLWYPEHKGGLGLRDRIENGIIQSEIEIRSNEIDLDNIIIADVGGVAGAITWLGVGGATAAIIPGTNAAIAGSVAFAGAFASASSWAQGGNGSVGHGGGGSNNHDPCEGSVPGDGRGYFLNGAWKPCHEL